MPDKLHDMIIPDSFGRIPRVAYGPGEVRSGHLGTRANPANDLNEVEVAEPERALAAGVLRQATADLRRFRNSEDPVGQEMHADAYSWFISNDTNWPYSFCNVCQVLGLSTDAVLDEVLAEAESSWYLRLRRIAQESARVVKVSLSPLFTRRRSQRFTAVK
jgi:hypothetical protein